MSTRKGTGYVVALFLAFSLLCSVSLVAQDKVLITATNNKTADSTSVNCSAFAADGTTCIAGQYYNSDMTTPSASWAGTATSSSFGPWTASPNNGSPNGCLSCHHSSVNKPGIGGGYLVGGHKNVLRKIVPGQTLLDTQGVKLSALSDHDDGTLLYTLDQAAGTMTNQRGVPTTVPGYFTIGWYAGATTGGYRQGMTYGSCARCHTTGYRPDGNAPEPTLVTPGTSTTPTTYTKLTDAQFGRIPSGATAPATSSWSLTGIQCERCHKADMQYDATSVNPLYNSGTATAPVWTATNGRVSHFVKIQVPTNQDSNANLPGTDFYVAPPHTGAADTRPLPKPPSALTCLECHQAYSTWTAKTAGQVGQVHLTPTPGFESLAPTMDSAKFTTTKAATGQFSATFACSVASITAKTPNYYTACIAAGGTVTYVPGGMSHGAVATILNSPHARVTGYVDVKNPGTADNTLTIIGGTLADGTIVTPKFNSFFSSTGTTDGVTVPKNGVTGSCAGCHNIHSDMVSYKGFTPAINATNIENPLTSCTTCHTSHGKAMNHPTGAGTPYAVGGFGGQESCSTCHLSKKSGTLYHFLRINPDPTYTTFPPASDYYTKTGSGQFGKLNTYPESYTDTSDYSTKTYPAVGLDVDIACGQCHTGGNGGKNPYGLTPYAGDGGVQPRPYSRAFLAAAAVSMHNTNAAVPTFNVALPSSGAPTDIIISASDVSEGSKVAIFYTLDGSKPTVTSNSVAVAPTMLCATNPCDLGVISKTTTIYALAAGPQSYGFTPSAVVGGTYGVQVAPKPVISPTGANYTYSATGYQVKLSDTLTAASICYTTNGSTPVAGGTCVASGSAITIRNSIVLKAIATAANYAPSGVNSATFTIVPPTPTWSNVGAKFPGTYTGAVTAILTDADASAYICYTTNGTTPVVPCNGATVFSGSAITVSASETIKAIAIDGTAASKVTSGTFTIR